MLKSLRLRNFRKLRDLTIKLRSGNIVVGPNNSGKSSILDGFRLLEACLRHSRSKSPTLITIDGEGTFYGYNVPDSSLPFRLGNITTDFSDSDAIVEFENDAGHRTVIRLHPDRPTRFYVDALGVRTSQSAKFRQAIGASLIIVPTLSPLEVDEDWVEDATIQRALGTRVASRHLRNYWLRAKDAEFDSFKAEVETAWPGIVIQRPEMPLGSRTINMYYTENRITREVQWAGFGFQVWMQIQTHLSRGGADAILIIDEPDIYLHSDLQHRLLRRIRERFSQYVMATHSVEIINEASSEEIVFVNPRMPGARRVRSDEEYEALFRHLGTTQNADFARVARARKVIFVEGQDAKLLRRFAAQFGYPNLADAQSSPIVQLGGFSQFSKATHTVWAFKKVLDLEISTFCILDKDYRCDDEVAAFIKSAADGGVECCILDVKEIENFLLDASALQKALASRLKERGAVLSPPSEPEVANLIAEVCEDLRTDTMVSRVSEFIKYAQATGSSKEHTALFKEGNAHFDSLWKDLPARLAIVPGKEVFGRVSDRIQKQYKVTVSAANVINNMKKSQAPEALLSMLSRADAFAAD